MKALIMAFAIALAPSHAEALLCTPFLGCSCNVSVTDMAFGAIQPLSGAPATATADVIVGCTGVIDVAPLVYAEIGPGAHGSIGDRQMDSAGARLHYNIYSSTAYTTILGEGVGGYPPLTVSGGILTLGNWSVTTSIYGLAPSAPTAVPGAYSDTIMVRIEW